MNWLENKHLEKIKNSKTGSLIEFMKYISFGSTVKRR
jgi:hypothetical protein